MRTLQLMKKTTVVAAIAAILATGITAIGIQGAQPTYAASKQEVKHSAKPAVKENTEEDLALATLNSFYKPALKGKFPGSVNALTLGVSTRKDVKKLLDEPTTKGKDSDDFDLYHAEMGHPGYAISYKLDKIKEMRYFGTNVSKESNIGGITQVMLKKAWGKADEISTFKTGKVQQTKIVYDRGDYALSFIFNDKTTLDHINLTKKPVKK